MLKQHETMQCAQVALKGQNYINTLRSRTVDDGYK